MLMLTTSDQTRLQLRGGEQERTATTTKAIFYSRRQTLFLVNIPASNPLGVESRIGSRTSLTERAQCLITPHIIGRPVLWVESVEVGGIDIVLLDLISCCRCALWYRRFRSLDKIKDTRKIHHA